MAYAGAGKWTGAPFAGVDTPVPVSSLRGSGRDYLTVQSTGTAAGDVLVSLDGGTTYSVVQTLAAGEAVNVFAAESALLNIDFSGSGSFIAR